MENYLVILISGEIGYCRYKKVLPGAFVKIKSPSGIIKGVVSCVINSK